MQQKGYTIIELLVVVTVIGILATIALASYNSMANRSNDAAVRSDLDAIAGQLEAYHVSPNSPSEFPRDAAALTTLGIKAAKKSYQTTINANFIYCITSDYQSFSLVAKSKADNFFRITEDGFKPYTLSASDFTTAALCPALGMNWVSSRMSAPNTWQAWVGSS